MKHDFNSQPYATTPQHSTPSTTPAALYLIQLQPAHFTPGYPLNQLRTTPSLITQPTSDQPVNFIQGANF